MTTSRATAVKPWALFTGLVRNEAVFRSQLETWARWRGHGWVGEVVWSTWIGELDRYPGLREWLRGHGVHLVESGAPNLILDGHVLHQMKALWHGLEVCPGDAWVLRLRPDVGGLEQWERVVRGETDLSLPDAPDWPRIFRNRIQIVGTHVLYPFFITDTQFFGRGDDLRKLVHFDLRYEMLYAGVVAEQHFFAHPFLQEFPIFASYFLAGATGLIREPALARAYIRAHVASPFFLKVLATYVRILRHYFRIGIWPGATEAPAEFLEQAARGGLVELLDGSVPVLGVAFARDLNYASTNGEWLIQALLAGGFSADGPGQALQAALREVSQPGFHRAWTVTALRPQPEVLAFQLGLPIMARGPRIEGRLAMPAPGGGASGREWQLRHHPIFRVETSAPAEVSSAKSVAPEATLESDPEILRLREYLARALGQPGLIDVAELVAATDALAGLLQAPDIALHLVQHRGTWPKSTAALLRWHLAQARREGQDPATRLLEEIHQCWNALPPEVAA